MYCSLSFNIDEGVGQKFENILFKSRQLKKTNGVFNLPL